MSTSRIAPVVAPIEKTRVAEAAFDQLISFVVKSHWRAGDKIPPERELCQQLGIARTSLREALKAMEMIGMLDSRVGDGTFVCPRSEFLARPLLWTFTGMDHEELRDILEARLFMERDLAGLAAERGAEEQVDKIGEALQVMRQRLGDGASILDADMDFHQAIAEAAHNDVMRMAVQLLRNLIRHWIERKLEMEDVGVKTLDQHAAIYKAIRKRDPAAAREAMRKHLQDTVSLVNQIFRSRVPQPKGRRRSGPRS